MKDTALPEPDRIDGVPHPRETVRIFGQAPVEADVLESVTSGRLHHAWLLTGPRGIGKATMAWRIARFLLATSGADEEEGGLFGDAPPPPDSLDIPADHPVARRVTMLSEPGLFLLRRGANDKGDRLSSDIRVGEVRKLSNFLHLSATEGGRRVVIVDSADDMNAQAANALLKMLEEPPARVTFLLVSHQPARLLPTIRSRCREVRLNRLAPDDLASALSQAGADPGQDTVALAELSGGSVGEALRLIHLDGLGIYGELAGIAAELPQLDRPRALKLAEMAAARGAEEKLDLLMGLGDILMARLARCGATGTAPRAEAAPSEAEILAHLAPTPAKGRAWADCAQEIGTRMRQGRAVNLDPAALVLDMVFQMQKTATG